MKAKFRQIIDRFKIAAEKTVQDNIPKNQIPAWRNV